MLDKANFIAGFIAGVVLYILMLVLIWDWLKQR